MAVSSKYISDAFCADHRHILRSIEKLICDHPSLDKFITDATYTSLQNKKLRCFMIEGDALSMLLGMRFLSKHKEHEKEKLDLIKKEKINCISVSGVYTRFEDSFYDVLSKIIHTSEIKRQFKVMQYRVDFYIKNANIIIEYDEEQHGSKKSIDADNARIEEIKNYLIKKRRLTPITIRVKKGNEGEGIGLICAYVSSLYPKAFRYSNLVLSKYTHNV